MKFWVIWKKTKALCTAIQCLNDGVCSGINRCNCTGTGYKGLDCSDPDCDPPCQNGGDCVDVNVCDCSFTQYEGRYCDERKLHLILSGFFFSHLKKYETN